MTLAQSIHSLDDPRVAGYRRLRERSLRDEGLFITEGALLAERLLESRFPVESLLVSAHSARSPSHSPAHFASLMRDGTPLYVAEPELLRQIVGFDFHRGVLGLGRRLPFPNVASLVERLIEQPIEPLANGLAEPSPQAQGRRGQRLHLVACPGTEGEENLGLIVRSARAFGVHGLLLPEDGADPLSRRCLRQSMGGAFALPTARSSSLLAEMRALRQSIGLRLVAAVAGSTQNGTPSSVIELADFCWPNRAALIVGNEYHGLDPLWLENCDYQVTIATAPGCDSLNVAVATGVLLHQMRSASTAQAGEPNGFLLR